MRPTMPQTFVLGSLFLCVLALPGSVGADTPEPSQTPACRAPFYASQGLCLHTNKKCAPSRNFSGCWSPVESFGVGARTSKDNPVIFKNAPNIQVRVEKAWGNVCVVPDLVCGGPSGASLKDCHQVSDDCVCPLPCPNAAPGALMRDACVPVEAGTFASGNGRHVYYINLDCRPENNTGSFGVKLSY